MSDVFVSYCHQQPDQGIAELLAARLQATGHDVFIDQHIKVGFNWIETISKKLDEMRYFVVLISERSVERDMVRKEIEHAYHRLKNEDVVILPVRVNYQARLPYDLGGYLDPIQYLMWQPGIDDEIVAKIEAAIGGSLSGPEWIKTENAHLDKGASQHQLNARPLPAADLRIESGAMLTDSPLYIPREADRLCKEALSGEGGAIIVKGPTQAGKSSLLSRVKADVDQRPGWESVYVNFQLTDRNFLEDLDSVFKHLAMEVHEAVSYAPSPQELWDPQWRGPKKNMTHYLEQTLNKNESNLVLILDNADVIFHYDSYRTDFFSAARGWHELRTNREAWKRLFFVIAHATDDEAYITTEHQSPFNVGTKITVDNLNEAEIQHLNELHAKTLNEGAGEIEKLMSWIGGQAYLIRLALHEMTTKGMTLSDLIENATSHAGPFGDHLRSRSWLLHNDQATKVAFADVLQGRGCRDSRVFDSLVAAGLLTGRNNTQAEVSCRLYGDYFKQVL